MRDVSSDRYLSTDADASFFRARLSLAWGALLPPAKCSFGLAREEELLQQACEGFLGSGICDHVYGHYQGVIMQAMSLAHAKAHLSELLNAVEAGEEVVITRHGRPIARVVPANPPKEQFPLQRLATLRQQVPAWKGSSAASLRALRDAE